MNSAADAAHAILAFAERYDSRAWWRSPLRKRTRDKDRQRVRAERIERGVRLYLFWRASTLREKFEEVRAHLIVSSPHARGTRAAMRSPR